MAVIIYYSRDEENFVKGKIISLKKGNTKRVAEKLAKLANLPIAELIPLIPYPKKYQQTVYRAEKEKKEQLRPKYLPLGVETTQHQEIFLGYPNWWGTFPMIIASFLEDHDLTGKTIFPFCTHEGSGLGGSVIDLERKCPTSIIKTGLPIRGSKVEESDQAIANWLVQYHKYK